MIKLLFFGCCFFFISKRTLRYLRYLQQEEYNTSRFLNWIRKHRAFDRKGAFALLFIGISYPFISHYALLLGSGLIFGFTFREGDPRKEGKLPLNMTPRAKRIYYVALAIYAPFQIALAFFPFPFWWLAQTLLFQLIPIGLILSVKSLDPGEKRRQKKLISQAKQRWEAVSPYTIGITGSYGKTSTKDALGNILQTTLGATFWPEKGINTPMGITRKIRTHLRHNTPYAVIEMGAYGSGSIRRLCDLTPPHAGIITGIGIAHLDRFGTVETIRRAKGELAEALPEDGVLVCNGDNTGARQIATENPKQQTLLYGYDNKQQDLDCWITSYKVTPEGVEFTLQWKGENYDAKTPLLGKPAISNIAATFTMACALGAQPEFVIGAIANLRPVGNRLEITKDGETTYLHDAYNSNPEGFTSALETLGAIPAKKKILMTPGMIELAGQVQEEHERIGHLAAGICDLAIVVGETNRQSLSNGLRSGGMTTDKILLRDTREQAFKELGIRLKEGDAVLIENDLPDLYEAQERF